MLLEFGQCVSETKGENKKIEEEENAKIDLEKFVAGRRGALKGTAIKEPIELHNSF